MTGYWIFQLDLSLFELIPWGGKVKKTEEEESKEKTLTCLIDFSQVVFVHTDTLREEILPHQLTFKQIVCCW